MKELIKFITSAIVKYPKDIDIKVKSESEEQIEYMLSVNPEDMGKIIGKNGKVIKAIRELLRVKGIQENKKIFLYLKE